MPVAANTYNRIILKGDSRYEEDPASAAITPGHFLQRDSLGVKVHATSGGFGERAIAIEDALQGKTIDDAYAADDICFYHVCKPGDEVYALIEAGQTIVKGDELVSSGSGTLIKGSGVASGVTVEDVFAIAMEAIDLSASGAVDTRLPVRIR